MSFGERAALEGILSQLTPDLALELGTAEGGSLERLAHHSAEVHSFDLVAPSLPVAELAKRAAESDLQLLDVREHGEWDLGHIPGSLFHPWHELDELPAGLDPERPVAVLCASGERAATAASLLQRLGVARVTHVTEGGVPSWGELGNPIEITADPTGAPSS